MTCKHGLLLHEPAGRRRHRSLAKEATSHRSKSRHRYLGPGKIGAFFGIGTIRSRRSPLLFATFNEMLPAADAASMLLATCCALPAGLPPTSTMTSLTTIPFS